MFTTVNQRVLGSSRAGLVYESDGTSESYTKHYYAGPLRVASQIGSGNPNYETHPTSGGNLAQGGPVNAAAPTNGLAVLGDLNSMLANYGMSVSSFRNANGYHSHAGD